jgi:hypothetical protein
MNLHRGIGLRGDEIAITCGYDGSEPRQIRRRKPDPGQCRLALGISTYYEDVAGAYYFNRALLGLVQDCLFELGWSVVIQDILDPQVGVLPAEERCALELDEDYVLVDSSCVKQGRMLLWRIEYHPKGSLFKECDIICDMLLSSDMAAKLRGVLKERCRQAGVPLISND